MTICTLGIRQPVLYNPRDKTGGFSFPREVTRLLALSHAPQSSPSCENNTHQGHAFDIQAFRRLLNGPPPGPLSKAGPLFAERHKDLELAGVLVEFRKKGVTFGAKRGT
jgi:hypothetical protein